MRRSHQIIFAGWFLTLILSVPLTQAALEISRGTHPQFLDVFTRWPTHDNLRFYERQLEESSVFAERTRPWVQYVWFRWLGEPGEKVVVGWNGWLFYKPDIRYLVEPGVAPKDDPFTVILDFRDQLAARGIRLMVLPIPGKPSVYPDQVTRRVTAGTILRSHTQDLTSRLRAAGLEVVNLLELFRNLRGGSGEPIYLLRDTHWSCEAAEKSANVVAARIRELGFVNTGTVDFAVRPRVVLRSSDIARMIRVPDIERRYAAEDVPCAQVWRPDTGGVYRDDPRSPVLVLGDSFLRIYQTDQPGAAGFIAQLARRLKMPLATIVNDGGASTLVRQQLSRNPELLSGKRLVIWEFVERDVRFGTEGWKRVSISGEQTHEMPASAGR